MTEVMLEGKQHPELQVGPLSVVSLQFTTCKKE